MCDVAYESSTYRNQPDTSFSTITIHLPLFFPVDKTVVVLHGNKLGLEDRLARLFIRLRISLTQPFFSAQNCIVANYKV